MALFHNNETQFSLFETSHYPFLPRLLLLYISRLKGFILSLYMEFFICSTQSPSTWEQFKSFYWKKCLAILEFFKLWSIGKPQSTPYHTSHFPFHFSSSCPPSSLQYFDCCIYQGVPNQVSLLKKITLLILKQFLNNHCYTFPRKF